MDDFLEKRRESIPILDLSKMTVATKEDFKLLMEKVPDFKIRPEKVALDTIKIKDKKFKFKTVKSDMKAMKEHYKFLNPLPVEMQHLKIADFSPISIDWKMLTDSRPKSKVEEHYFSRLVELGKLQHKTRHQEKGHYAMDPQIRRFKNKAGVLETKVVACAECGEEFCTGNDCVKFGYDSFVRIQEEKTEVVKKPAPQEAGGQKKFKKKIKRRSRSKTKSGALKKDTKKSVSPKKGEKKKSV